MLRNTVARSNKSLSSQKFGVIHPPRTRADKMKHISVLDSVPLEMVPAVDERNQERSGRISKRSDPISKIVLRYETTPETELIQSLCKACATNEFDPTVWEILIERTKEVRSSLNLVDIGLILKCAMLYERGSRSFSDPELISWLLNRLGTQSGHGMYSILFGLQGLNHFRSLLDPKLNKRYFNNLLKNLRYGSAGTLMLISCVQAVSLRDPLPSPEVVAALLAELSSRCLTECDTDTIFGLLSSVARLPQSPEWLELMTHCKRLLDDSHLSGLSLEQLVGVSHAFSRMGPAVSANNIDIFTKVGNELVMCDESWTPRTFSVVINAFGSGCIAHSDLLEVLKKTSANIVDEMDSRQVSMSIYGLAKLDSISEFKSLVERAELLVTEFDLHSTSKLIAAIVQSSNYTVSKYLKRTRDLLGPIGKNRLSRAETESISLILTSLRANNLTAEATSDMEFLFDHYRANVGSCDLAKTALLVNTFVDYNSRSFTELCRSILDRLIHDPSSAKDLSLNEMVKFMHAFGERLKLTPAESDSLRRIVLDRISPHLGNLGYRSLTRLGASLVRCGIYDDDLLAVIDGQLCRFKH